MYRAISIFMLVFLATHSAHAGPSDLFSETVKDFGVTPRGSVLVHYFRFTNTTNQTLTIGNPRVSCGCVSATVSKNQVGPGETAAVIAFMDTRRIQTPNIVKSVTIYVPFTGIVTEEAVLRVQTVARDDLVMIPDTLAFGVVAKGQSAKVSTKVSFLSDPNWSILEVKSSGAFVNAEQKLDSRKGNTITYEITATLDKACPVGNWTSDIYLKTSNPAVAQLRIPVTVQVTSAVAALPEAVAFGELQVGKSVEQKVTLKSGTGAPFKILQINGLDDELKAVVQQSESSAVQTVILAAHPNKLGGFHRTVEIVTDNPEQPKIIVPVTAKVIQQ
jgi:hypothetical protein